MTEVMHGFNLFDKLLDDTWHIEGVLFEDLDGNRKVLTNWRFPNPFQNNAKGPISDLRSKLQILDNRKMKVKKREEVAFYFFLQPAEILKINIIK